MADRPDFPGIIRDLNAAGLSCYKIGLACRAQTFTVQRWRNGSEPKHSQGVELINLHRLIVGKEAENGNLMAEKKF